MCDARIDSMFVWIKCRWSILIYLSFTAGDSLSRMSALGAGGGNVFFSLSWVFGRSVFSFSDLQDQCN